MPTQITDGLLSYLRWIIPITVLAMVLNGCGYVETKPYEEPVIYHR
jgi:hypothetical protein